MQRTHCKASRHPWTEWNIYTAPNGKQRCRACHLEANQRAKLEAKRLEQPAQPLPLQAECRRGHGAENYILQKSGKHQCAVCHRESDAARRGKLVTKERAVKQLKPVKAQTCKVAAKPEQKRHPKPTKVKTKPVAVKKTPKPEQKVHIKPTVLRADDHAYVQKAAWRCSESPSGAHSWWIENFMQRCQYCGEKRPLPGLSVVASRELVLARG